MAGSWQADSALFSYNFILDCVDTLLICFYIVGICNFFSRLADSVSDNPYFSYFIVKKKLSFSWVIRIRSLSTSAYLDLKYGQKW